ncbi:YecH family metal-binding protein [Thaumasiovibrio sp. DFM-14]|uniref:YecH family metal-binding protein n=1 Tax=Thaumasiovibrio sp. DFM-14 TaxID=3384792 RepID=UPI0039A259E9
MTESVSVHAHAVLAMLSESDIPYTVADFTDEVVRNMGKEVVFHTCKQQDLSLAELLSFLISRGKVVQDGEFITVNQDKICRH